MKSNVLSQPKYINEWNSRHCHKYISCIWIYTLRPQQNGRYFAVAIFKSNFFRDNVGVLNKISLKFIDEFCRNQGSPKADNENNVTHYASVLISSSSPSVSITFGIYCIQIIRLTVITIKGLFCARAQAMRDDITMYCCLSLAGCMPFVAVIC